MKTVLIYQETKSNCTFKLIRYEYNIKIQNYFMFVCLFSFLFIYSFRTSSEVLYSTIRRRKVTKTFGKKMKTKFKMLAGKSLHPLELWRP